MATNSYLFCSLVKLLTFFVLVYYGSQNAGAVNLLAGGAGSTAALFRKWYTAYAATHSRNVTLTYLDYSSTYGKAWIKREIPEREGQIPVYVGSDTPYPDKNDYKKFPDLQFFPVVGGAVVLAFNLPEIKKLVLTGEIVAAIFNGSISTWDHPTLREHNLGTRFPSRKIRVMVRRDGAGSTGVTTAALTTFSEEWRNRKDGPAEFEYPVMKGPEGPSNWPTEGVEFYAFKSNGMAAMVASIPFSFAYCETADAFALNLDLATLKNPAGNDISPDALGLGVRSAMDHFAKEPIDDTLTMSLLNAPEPNAYPMCFVSYIIINMKTADEVPCEYIMAFIRVLIWTLNDEEAQKIPLTVHMVPLRPSLVKIVMERIVEKITCRGDRVIDLIRREDEAEAEMLATKQSNTTILIIATVVSCAGILLITLIGLGYFQYRKTQLEEDALAQLWKLDWSNMEIRNNTKIASSTSFSNNFSMQAKYFGEYVYIKAYKKRAPDLRFRSRNTLLMLKMLKTATHENLNDFLGLCLDVPERSIAEVWKYCAKGSLKDVLYAGGTAFNLDKTFKVSMASDIIKGLTFLHSSEIGTHGRLLVSNCVVDNQWCVKLTDFGTDNVLADLWSDQLETKFDSAEDMLYLAPEAVKARSKSIKDGKWPRVPYPKNPAEDIFALGMVLYQVFFQMDPYDLSNESISAVINKILSDSNPLPRIPNDMTDGSADITDIVLACLLRLANMRPAIEDIAVLFKEKFSEQSGSSIVEHMVTLMEEYTKSLSGKTKELAQQRARADALLYKILPKSIASALLQGVHVPPESFDCATIFFSDIKGFTTICSTLSPMNVVAMLNQIYSRFDHLISEHDTHKAEVIGDAYMVASGVPVRNGDKHATEIAKLSLRILHYLKTTEIPLLEGKTISIQIRIGLHSGPVAAGVVGLSMPRYCIFGDTVNTAAHMESSGQPMKIHISKATKKLIEKLDKGGEYTTASRGPSDIKGLDVQPTFWLFETSDTQSLAEVSIA